MCKGKRLLKKLLAVTAVVGAAAVLVTKLKKNCKGECPENDFEDEEDPFEEDASDRNYVSLSHGEEAAQTDSEEQDASEEETAPEEVVSEEAASSAEEIAAKLEQAVAETEARYEEARKEAESEKK
ncbi:MAG: hypothetical protein HFI63_01650 [Lachnospiraceae bacterium]|nr:hypothetical protein [Lachnospiraceae bacterium]